MTDGIVAQATLIVNPCRTPVVLQKTEYSSRGSGGGIASLYRCLEGAPEKSLQPRGVEGGAGSRIGCCHKKCDTTASIANAPTEGSRGVPANLMAVFLCVET